MSSLVQQLSSCKPCVGATAGCCVRFLTSINGELKASGIHPSGDGRKNDVHKARKWKFRNMRLRNSQRPARTTHAKPSFKTTKNEAVDSYVDTTSHTWSQFEENDQPLFFSASWKSRSRETETIYNTPTSSDCICRGEDDNSWSLSLNRIDMPVNAASNDMPAYAIDFTGTTSSTDYGDVPLWVRQSTQEHQYKHQQKHRDTLSRIAEAFDLDTHRKEDAVKECVKEFQSGMFIQKEKSNNQVDSRVTILGVEGSSCPSIQVTVKTDGTYRKFIFNCGEGLQKLLKSVDSRHKDGGLGTSSRQIWKNGDIFITRSSWEAQAGLFGLIESDQSYLSSDTLFKNDESGASNYNKLQVTAPREWFNRLQETQRWFNFKTVELLDPRIEKIYDPYGDGLVEITASAIESEHGDLKEVAFAFTMEVKYNSNISPGAVAAVGLNIRDGKSISTLRAGIPIKKQGRIIDPLQIQAPQIHPNVVMTVIDCPDVSYIPALLGSRLAQHHHISYRALDVYHFAPYAVVSDPRYQELVKRFPEASNHIYFYKEVAIGRPTLSEKLAHQMLLHEANKEIFPLRLSNNEPTWKHNHKICRIHMDDGVKAAVGQSAYLFDKTKTRSDSYAGIGGHANTMRPISARQFDPIPDVDIRNNSTFEKLRNRPQIPLQDKLCAFNEDATLVVLGTSSRVPTWKRNVSGALLQIEEQFRILLDCGEGTVMQLESMYGQQLPLVLQAIRVVFISHIHTDHCLGLGALINERNNIVSRQIEDQRTDLLVCGPPDLFPWLKELPGVNFEYVKFVQNSKLYTDTTSKELKSLMTDFDVEKIQTVPVYHCKDASGLVVTHNTGWKFVYSGDCMPSRSLIQAGKNATLLLHEATFVRSSAAAGKHSTVKDALKVGDSMNAQYTVLTHFSTKTRQLYLPRTAATVPIVGFDNMVVKFSDLSLAGKLTKEKELLKLFAMGTKDVRKIVTQNEQTKQTEQIE